MSWPSFFLSQSVSSLYLHFHSIAPGTHKHTHLNKAKCCSPDWLIWVIHSIFDVSLSLFSLSACLPSVSIVSYTKMAKLVVFTLVIRILLPSVCQVVSMLCYIERNDVLKYNNYRDEGLARERERESRLHQGRSKKNQRQCDCASSVIIITQATLMSMHVICHTYTACLVCLSLPSVPFSVLVYA